MSKHTVTVSLEDDEYAQLKELAENQDRYISGQARHMLREMLKIYTEAQIPLAATHMAGAGSAPEDRTSSAPPVPSATYVGDDGPDATLGEQQRAKQEPLPG